MATPFDDVGTLYADTAALTLAVEGTTRPQISWDAVAGVDRYSLVILTDAGETVWASNGIDTAVVVGGGVDRTGLGARVATPSWGLIIARDPAGAGLAGSDPIMVGPVS